MADIVSHHLQIWNQELSLQKRPFCFTFLSGKEKFLIFVPFSCTFS